MRKLLHSIPYGLQIAGLDVYLFVRGVIYVGNHRQCPCCRWRSRSFVMGGGSFRKRSDGYCPRCNSKGRHRRACAFLEKNPDLVRGRILHIAPHFSMWRRFSRSSDVDYISLDIKTGSMINTPGDITLIPLEDDTVDGVVCIHVLEHVDRDIQAMDEMFRVLRPGGWVLINVPLHDGDATYEDASITTPARRREVFGEDSHVRLYGHDIADRLAATGFSVEFDAAPSGGPESDRFGIPSDEHIFLCRKPRAEVRS